jgi:WD40 repeat protein
VAFSPDGRTIQTRTRNRANQTSDTFWDAATHEAVFPNLSRFPTYLAATLDPAMGTVLGANGNFVKRFDLDTGKVLGWFDASDFRVLSLSASRMGLVAATCQDKTAHILDCQTLKPVGPPLTHQDLVLDVELSADGKVAVTALDGGARFWHVATGKPLGPPLPHPEMGSMTLSPDGQTLATADIDGTERLWAAPVAVEDDEERVALWVQILTAMELDSQQAIRLLDGPTWQQRQQRLRNLGGPPMP